MQDGRVWITWENQRRNVSLSEKVKAELFVLTSSRKRLVRYLLLTLRTVGVISRSRPSVVFAQNPSIVLSALVILLRPVYRYTAVIDEHNSGLFPLEGESRILNYVAARIAKSADLVVVTNQRLKEYVQSIGGNAVVVPDPIPVFKNMREHEVSPTGTATETVAPLAILFICTWSTDEPYQRVIEAARQLDPNRIQIKITGNNKGKADPNSVPANIELTGFLSDEEYVSLLSQTDAVVVLTTREDCLNCGAYEAVALEKPGVLSDTTALKAYFDKGYVFTRDDPESIAEAIAKLYSNFATLKREVADLKQELQQKYDGYLTEAEASLRELSDRELRV